MSVCSKSITPEYPQVLYVTPEYPQVLYDLQFLRSWTFTWIPKMTTFWMTYRVTCFQGHSVLVTPFKSAVSKFTPLTRGVSTSLPLLRFLHVHWHCHSWEVLRYWKPRPPDHRYSCCHRRHGTRSRGHLNKPWRRFMPVVLTVWKATQQKRGVARRSKPRVHTVDGKKSG